MKKYKNPFKSFSKLEWFILFFSVIAVSASFLLVPEKDYLTLSASLVGVVALIFIAKGDPLGQILCVIFSIIYAIVSFSYQYYGEMITYLCMSAPVALAATISWFRHPYSEENNEVRVESLTPVKWLLLILSTAIVTVIFFFILRALNTANLLVSTFSVATSFFAASLTYLRSPYYGLGYGMNDIVLIALWIMAAIEDPAYSPMIICFVVFLLNDLYGFYNWRRIRKRQAAAILGKPSRDPKKSKTRKENA